MILTKFNHIVSEDPAENALTKSKKRHFGNNGRPFSFDYLKKPHLGI